MKNTFYISYADIISQLIYNQLGQLKIKKTGGTQNGSDRWQEVDYKYNIRGWLTDINDVGLVLYGKDAEPPTMGDDLFAFKINYNVLNDGGSQYAEPLYNGNIAQTIWRTGDDNVKRGYVYNYDELNRLLEAQFYKSDNNPYTGAYTENLAYDLNGNITSLFRTTGDVNGASVEMDDLAYSYKDGNGNSNLLLNVSDAVSNQNTGGFKDGNTNPALDDYEYDENGNMVKDRNKGITSITYNHLNLPERIEWSANKFITYQYNAAGQKVTKTVRSNDSIKVVRYLDGFQYAGDILQFFPHSEGYVKATPTGNITPGSPPTAYAYNYVFNYTDHLGNIRLSYTKDPQQGTLKILEEIEERDSRTPIKRRSHKTNNSEQNHYYPFGLKHEVYVTGSKRDFIENSNDPGETILTNVLKTDYQYKYNGKEFQDELGLNFYDYGWRSYMPDIGRWVQSDPLLNDLKTTIDFDQEDDDDDEIDMLIAFTKKMKVGGGVYNPYNLNPYGYGYNNPVSYDDPDGRCPWCLGAIVGAATDYGLQVAGNLIEGKSLGKSLTDVDGKSIAFSAVSGATGVGLVSKVGKVNNVINKANNTQKTVQKVNNVQKTTSTTQKVTGHTKHGLNQSISRNGGKGVSVKAKSDAIKTPQKVTSQSNGTTKYKGKDATVIVNKDKKVVTTFGKSRSSAPSQAQGRSTGGGKAQRRTQEATGSSYNPNAIK